MWFAFLIMLLTGTFGAFIAGLGNLGKSVADLL